MHASSANAPQGAIKYTLSPSLNLVTLLPTFLITPEPSFPGANGLIIYGEGPKTKDESKAFSNELKSKSLKGGYDIIYDPIGDCYTEPAFRAIGWKGKYLVVGFAAGEIPKLPINLTLLKGASLVGVFWGTFTGLESEVNQKNIAEINQLLSEGKIKPLISKEVPMENAVEAIKMIGNRGVIGKVVLVNK